MFKMYIYKSLINPGTHSFNVNGIKIVDDIILNLDKITVSSFLLWKYWYVKEPLCKKKKNLICLMTLLLFAKWNIKIEPLE